MLTVGRVLLRAGLSESGVNAKSCSSGLKTSNTVSKVQE